ncbi:polysaccharide pyruvyl transferase family protein [Butyrivibrio sp. AC2005]|uniref:polysaccharide pyruvyl transferase family protein n=1 Tax=Butyrivibrio sp. AC2005 TaxID=1280672 RepID=UPI0003F5FB92|nr:polysaccharide pyruvyl transferase family protein [Butyrivibrio sp. AC2005]
MKIGIITFHRAVNYGAVLQAYALQHILEKMGNDVEIIDYRSPKIEEDASPFVGFKKRSGFSTAFKRCIFRSRKNLAFHFFFKKYIRLSKKAVTNQELRKLANKYDCVITGSDQVWNIGCSGNDATYFLDFVEEGKKKVAYAVSFGGDVLYYNKAIDYKKLITDYNGISVRERSGVPMVKEAAEREAQVVLDPTLLLTREDWKAMVGNRPIKEKYIFVYYLRPPVDLMNYVRELSKKTGYKIINAKSSKAFFLKNSPADFLTWIYHSEYFVTNSFHGTVFSLIFKKKFAIELNNKFDLNNRSKELLDMVKIDRNLSLEDIDFIDKEIDYSSVDAIISKEREKSIEFINKSLDKCKE